MGEATTEAEGRERILDAAIVLFAAHGVTGASLKAIAEQAEVSPALIIHHFGSKAGLRAACDAAVVGTLRRQLRDNAAAGRDLDLLAALRERLGEQAAALPYLARSLAEGADDMAALVDELADETEAAMAAGVADGRYRPTDHPRERAVVMLIWSLGAVVLHEHLARLLGVDFGGTPRDVVPYLRGASSILADGVLTPAMHAELTEVLGQLEEE